VLEGPRSTTVTAQVLREVLAPRPEPPGATPVRVYSGEWAVAEVQAEFKLVGKDGADAIWIRRLDDAVVGMPAPFETVAGGPLPDSSAEVLRVPAQGAQAPPAVPLLPDRTAEAWDVPAAGEAPEWIVDVALDGTWWLVTVADPDRVGEPAHVFAAVDVASDDASPLETRLDSGELLSDPALPDAVVVGGTLPLAFGLRARARARLGLAVSVAGAEVAPGGMRYLGRHFADSTLTFFVPPWMPERPDWFSTLAAETEPSPAWSQEPWATISAKRGTGVYLMEGPIDLTPEEVRFLTRMDKSE
jgi:hypothetical protein